MRLHNSMQMCQYKLHFGMVVDIKLCSNSDLLYISFIRVIKLFEADITFLCCYLVHLNYIGKHCHHKVQTYLKLVYIDFTFTLSYGQGLTHVWFNSFSMDSECHKEVFVHFQGQRLTLMFCYFSTDFYSLLCQVLNSGGDTDTPSSYF